MWLANCSVVVGIGVCLWSFIGGIGALCICSPFIFALGMGPCSRPGPCNALLLSLVIFMGVSIWCRCFLVACRHQWQEKMSDDLGVGLPKARPLLVNTTLASPNAAVSMASEAAELEAEESSEVHAFLNQELRQFCSRSWEEDELPSFYPLYQPPKGSMSESSRHSFFRMRCPAWMCTFPEQHERNKWGALMALCTVAAMNILYVFFPCPKRFNVVNECFGFGKCRRWWVWVWVWFAPMLLVASVTFIGGFDYGSLSELLLMLFNILLEDVERLMFITVILLLIVAAYLSRGHIYAFLGIDDRSLLHYVSMETTAGEGIIFQLCIWRVDANQRAIQALERAGPAASRSETLTEELLKLKNEESFMEKLFVKKVERKEREDKLIPLVGRTSNIFVRIAYGDNEPQNSRVVRPHRQMQPDTVVPFQETFRLELETDKDERTRLNIEVRDQTLIGAHEPGRVSFELEDIRSALKRSQRAAMAKTEPLTTRMLRPPGAGPESMSLVQLPDQDLSWAPVELSAAQMHVMYMMRSDPRLGQEEQAMYDAGFEPYPLQHGGTIWLAFAELPRDLQSKGGAEGSLLC
mmetsp:Transcript_16256/g.33692  ORF Transcript_16256/g.33692 Transcript_16256/m.33692 type:complete len:579 (-) Transcript_16256:39-1775(-)